MSSEYGFDPGAELLHQHFNADALAGKDILMPSIEGLAMLYVCRAALEKLQSALGFGKNTEKGK
jgi:hypothetical protein